MAMTKIIEILRWVAAGAGFYWGYSLTDPVQGFKVMSLVVVLSIAGLTGLESLLFSESAAEKSGYGKGSPYQRQSGFNNLAVAIAMVVVWLLGWGVKAMAAVTLVLLVFLVLSAANHAFSAIKEGNRSVINLLRPVLTGALLGGVLPLMFMAFMGEGK
jgi:hypothetical protein